MDSSLFVAGAIVSVKRVRLLRRHHTNRIQELRRPPHSDGSVYAMESDAWD